MSVSLLVFFATSMFNSQSAFAGGVCLFDSNCSGNGQNRDGNPCTGVIQCFLGVCAQPPLSGNSCNDGVQCTTSDTCAVGLCVGVPNTGNTCGDQTSTTCNGPDTCIAGTCTNPNLKTGNPCDDGFECTTSDTCAVGVCVGVPNTGNNCGAGPDPNGCSGQDGCIAGFCVFRNDVLLGISCDNGDGQVCTGACNGFGSCGDGPGTGESCDDGAECTIADSCVVGECVGSIQLPGTSCDNGDGQTCTGACNVIGSCITAPATSGSCDDGNSCTFGNRCNAGVCDPGVPLTGTDCGAGGTECSNQDTCVDGTCQPNDKPDLCTVDELCKDGVCEMGTINPIPACIDPVGGELIPIEATSLILAGTQTTFSWMIPITVSAVGIVIVIARKFSKYQPE